MYYIYHTQSCYVNCYIIFWNMKSIMISTFKHLDLRSKPDGAFFVRLLFVIGMIFGCAFGFYFCDKTSAVLPWSITTFEYYFDALVYALWFSGAALALGTSYVGIFLIPMLSLVCACSLASSVTALYLMAGNTVLPQILICYAVPSAISLPCFFLIADSMMSASRKLYFFRFFDTAAGDKPYSRLRVLAAITVQFMISLYYYYLVPILLNKCH